MRGSVAASIARRTGAAGLSGALLLLAGCGGGGSSSSSDRVFLTDVRYGRLVDEGNGPRLVSPLTTVDLDPITGFVIPGSLQPLAQGVDVETAQTVGIGPDYLPVVIPRNGVVELRFSAPLDPRSLAADVLDADGRLVEDGSVQLRTDSGKGVALTLSQPAPDVVWLSPVTARTLAFPPSPVDFGPDGDPRASATGYLRLQLPSAGPRVVKGLGGATIGVRGDGLGSVATPIGLNPGNRVLDFVVHGWLLPTGDTFNGFLPDLRPPRIVRACVRERSLDFAAGDAATATEVHDASASFATLARGGLGEWAGARLTLRPGRADEETRYVATNTEQDLTLRDAFAANPRDGDVVRLERAESFEPDPLHPADPETWDPFDPENAANSDFTRFVAAYEVDANGFAVSGPLALDRPLPPFSELRVRFSEPIDPASLGCYEDFQVRFEPDRGFGSEHLSQAVLDPSGTTAILRPALEDPSSGTFQMVGWGRGVQELRLVVSLVPKVSYLQRRMSDDAIASFLDEGRRGVTDLGGEPLAFPDSQFDPAHPALEYSFPFVSDESASTQQPPPVVASWGVIVHRMQGRPHTDVDPVTGEPGVRYADQVGCYWPIADVNLLANGYLAGAPVTYMTKIHDDVFPPLYGQFAAFSMGAATPLASYTTASGPQPHDGARFQTVYRDVDCSPNRDALAGTLLDLYRLSWAPIGGHVTSDLYEDISIHCAHSSQRPSTAVTTYGGYSGAAFMFSGLCAPFDYDSWVSIIDPNGHHACGMDCGWTEGPNYWDGLVTTVAPGTSYKVTESSLFTPPFDSRSYEPWPAFEDRFQYNNGFIPQAEKDLRKSINDAYDCYAFDPWIERRVYSSDPELSNLGGDSLLIEVRIRPQTTNVSRNNGFTFAPGMTCSYWPMFRVFSVGSPGLPVEPDLKMKQIAARCAIGNTTYPQFTGPYDGDNSRYFAVFDWIKTTSIITSPFVGVVPAGTADPHWFRPIVLPDPADLPAGTQVHLQFEGANDAKGNGATGFSDDVTSADGRSHLAFRATFVGNPQTLLLPNFDQIAIPYLRPDGD
ncbi:MAG TPA: hypothetical protein VFG37_08720 [Planctomycetota bacterium]|nr:hypothetical protein [Planctomycetota bacterium]